MKKQKAIESVWLAKTLSVLLAVLILVAMCLVPTSAAELSADSASASTVAHSVNAEFTASIPAYVMPGEPGEASADYTVTLENAVIPDSHELTAKVEYSGTMREQNGVELPYELLDETGNTISSGAKILSKSAGTPTEAVSVSFGAALTAKAKYAGVYTDTATFTFDVAEKIYTLDEINADEHLFAIGQTKPEYVVAEFNEDYTEVTILKNDADSDGIMKDFVHYPDSSKSPMCLHADTLQRAIIKQGVNNIGDFAFYKCESLTDINIIAQLTSIGEAAFEACSVLAEINIPNSTITIERVAFWGCSSLRKIEIPDSVMRIEDSVFQYCSSLVKVSIPNNLQSLGKQVFSGCSSLTDVNIPHNLTTIPFGTFSACSSLEYISIPKNITEIGEYAFSSCSLKNGIDLPEELTSIGKYAFSGCKFTTIEIPKSVIKVGEGFIAFCSNIESITIHENVTYIDSNTFRYCPKLNTIYGISGSYAETLAAENGYMFVAL